MLQIAKILKSNGTDGGLLIGVRDIEVGQIDLQEPVFIEFDGLPVPFFIQDLQQRGTSKAIIHLNDITSLADAEEVMSFRWMIALEVPRCWRSWIKKGTGSPSKTMNTGS